MLIPQSMRNFWFKLRTCVFIFKLIGTQGKLSLEVSLNNLQYHSKVKVSVLGRDRKFLGREYLHRVLGRSRVESLGAANPINFIMKCERRKGNEKLGKGLVFHCRSAYSYHNFGSSSSRSEALIRFFVVGNCRR